MPIHYHIDPIQTPGGETRYKATVTSVDSVDLEGITREILDRGSTLGRADVIGVLSLFFDVVEDLMLQGRRVVTPLAEFGVSIKGTFESHSDRFDKRRHTVRAAISCNRKYQKSFHKKAKVQYRVKDVPSPYIAEFIDAKTKTYNRFVSPGSIAEVHGHELKFDAGDEKQGLFFVNDAEEMFRCPVYANNTDKQLIFSIPPLAPGEYRLRMVKSYRPGFYRDMTYRPQLTVEEES